MDDASVRMAFLVARAAERCGCFEPGDWPDVAASLLWEGDEDPEIAELAGTPPLGDDPALPNTVSCRGVGYFFTR
ncbi:hypothetical protein [Amycolatopsis sp. cmx-8-4]|uniref:hypothetical protein n=1 Tax=Amycolatopsis sp. cmx-8-4 TaxID=2790947 RepID=UPI003979364C